MDQVALGVEISVDRRHTSIVAAGPNEGGFTVVDLLEYFPGPHAAPVIIERFKAKNVVGVALDTRSPSATLLAPLKDAGVKVVEPSAIDLAVAHGEFLDRLNAGELRHVPRAELTAAVRAGTERPLAGGSAWQRRGSDVDVGPLNAATLAVWLWNHKPPEIIAIAAWI
jgi:hypothetical protein